MADPPQNCHICAGSQYVALLEVSEAIVAHRDLPSLFHDVADRLRRVAQFDYLSLVLHDAATNTMRLHVVEPSQQASAVSMFVLPTEDDPAGLVWKSQQPLITARVHDLRRYSLGSFGK
jgi:formate hydrogenlyase transcriptional activator